MVVVCTSSVTLNTETGYFVGHYDSIWYVEEEGANSGFKGIMMGRIYDFDTTGAFPPFSRVMIHCTLQGFGDFFLEQVFYLIIGVIRLIFKFNDGDGFIKILIV